MKRIQKVPLQQIDLSDDTFSINYLPDLRRLKASIQEIGLVQPVFLRRKLDGYQMICGFRRVSVMKELGESEVEARVLEEKEMEEVDLFSISLHENLTTRGFNTVEVAIALSKLVHSFHIHRTSVIKNYLPLFSLEPNEKILDTYLSLVRMENEVKSYILKEEVSRSNIRRLALFTSEDRMALIQFFSYLRLGENRLRETLTLFKEISQRDRCKVREIVDRHEIESLVSNKEFTPSQREERMKKILLDCRYPRMRRMEEMFEEKKKELGLPSDISLRPPPFFEGKGLKVEFHFETIEEYQRILSALSLLLEKEAFKQMIGRDENFKFQSSNVK